MAKMKADAVEQSRAALYIRVSTHWQIDRDSLPVQRQELINYCKYALNIDSFEVFEDAGYSAKNTDRPDYQKMMARMRTGEFSHLLVWKLDRISRNLLDFATMYQELKGLGVTFVSKNEQFDTSTAMGEAMLKIILVFAELERKLTSERVTAVMLSRAEGGKWNGGRTPLGYSYDKESDTFSTIEEEAAVVRMCYDLYEQEKSLVAVARALNERGIKSRRGYDFTPTTVQIILKNPFYIGTMRYNYRDEAKTGNNSGDFKPEDEWVMVPDHHEPLIEAERWNKVSEVLMGNRRITGGGASYNRKNTHIFAGLLRCSYCNSRMGATPDRERSNGWRPSVYLCSRKRRYSDCPNKYVSDVTLGPFVFNFIANMMKAQRSFGRSTGIETLEKKLLRGEQLADVAHIEGVGLQEFYELLRRGISQKAPYTGPNIKTIEDPAREQEKDLLASEKRKNERALTRLKNLYLFADDSMSEKDYVLEQKRLNDEIAKIDARLEALEKDMAKQFTISDDEFISKASYFIMTQNLTGKREVNYDAFVKKLDPRLLKDFLNSICSNFCIKDGRVESIRFKNGIEHRFLYKDNSD